MPHVETYVNGIWYPSVTTVMSKENKPWLEAWRDKWKATDRRGDLALRKTEIASRMGTEFHRCVEDWLDTGSYTTTIARVDGMMGSFLRWAMSIDGTIDHTELQVVSHKYKYSGTFDAVGTIGSVSPVLIDWKTSSRIYPEMGLQLAAYAQAYQEQTGKKAKIGLIVHVSKDKPHYKLTTKEFKLGKRVLNKFLKLREAFDDVEVKGEIS